MNTDIEKTDYQYFSEKFKIEFIQPNFEEKFFLKETGINTNHESIESYICLKDKLGKNFNWKIIKNASPYFRIEDGYIKVEISLLEKCILLFVQYFVMISLIICYGVAIYLLLLGHEKSGINIYLYTQLILIIFLPTMVLWLSNLTKSTRDAYVIQKRLIALQKKN